MFAAARPLALAAALVTGSCGGPGQEIHPSPIRSLQTPTNRWQEIQARFPVTALCFVESDNGCAVYGDSIYWTEDGGDHWRKADAPPVPKLRSVAYRTGTDVFATGGDFNPEESGPQFILKSTDAGRTWLEVKLTSSLPRHFLFNSIRWVTPRVGYVLGTSLFMTEDGGDSWKIKKEPESSSGVSRVPISEVIFADESRAWCLGENSVYRSTDGGTSWSLARELSSLLLWHEKEWPRYLRREPGGTLWVMGSQGSVLQSKDEGRTWLIITRIPRDQEIMDAHFTDARRGWALLCRRQAGWSEIISTEDGGSTWVREFWVRAELHRLQFVNEKTGWAAGEMLLSYRR